MSTPYFIYEIDQPNTINIFGDFENIIPTHIGVAHVFSKIKQKFQNRIRKELGQNFYILRIDTIHWIISKFSNSKIRIENRSNWIQIVNLSYKKLYQFLIPEFNLTMSVQ